MRFLRRIFRPVARFASAITARVTWIIMTKTESATQWMEKIAADNSHGYSQSVRWGPSYDCSSMVISAWEQSGVPVKSKGATYTGNMYSVFKQCGFQDVTRQCNLLTGGGILRGDVLLNHVNHTAMSVGGGRIVHARSSEGTSDTADNSGNEIRTQSYWNYPWDCVLRYCGSDDASEEPSTEENQLNEPKPNIILDGDVSKNVKVMQTLLNIAGDYGLDEDGEYGPLTGAALAQFQSASGLDSDGICGTETKRKLNQYF